jgi:predicted nucleic acid-binding protein
VPRAIRSAYIDTNVYFEAAGAGPLHGDSIRVIELAATRRIRAYGSAVLLRELRGVGRKYGTGRAIQLYTGAVVRQLATGKQTKQLAWRCADELKIKRNDAVHLALAFTARVDVFVSWNREDLVKRSTITGLHTITQGLGRPTPIILTPRQLLAVARRQGRRGRLEMR